MKYNFTTRTGSGYSQIALRVIAFSLVTCLLLGACALTVMEPVPGKVDECMSVEFTHLAGQKVSFGSLGAIKNLETKTWLSWISLDSTPATGYFVTLDANGSPNEFWALSVDSSARPILEVGWTTTNGAWRVNSGVSLATLHLIVFTYDRGSTANDPVAYVDGVLAATTEVGTPAGSIRNGTDVDMLIGAEAVPLSIDGRVASALIYNRILSAAEILSIYNSRSAIPANHGGLVFAPDLCGAAGLQTFDGVTLGASNVLHDHISGAAGTPSGSPVGRADAHLTYEDLF